MGLLSNLKRSSAAGGERTAAAEVDPVQAARARARRRLVGATVLLGVGVIGFPLLFETQPRPVPVDLPIDIPKKEGAPSLPLPPPRSASASAATPRVASGVIAERPAEPRRETPATKGVEPAPAPKGADTAAAPKSAEPLPAPKVAEPAPKTAEAPKPAASPKPPAAAAKPADDGQRAKALLEGKPAETQAPATKVAEAKPGKANESADKAPASAGRFVVQIAAYADMAPAREMRQRVEKLGLKSFTQSVEIDGATRIRVRVGPFGTRDEAERAAATLKDAGLPAAVLSQ
ncbi:MAG: SPOR domain-containing protein [Burkholderiaceae bacterium]